MALPSVIIMRDTRANQPAASARAAGSLYDVTDEGVLERTSGSAWELVADRREVLGYAISDETTDLTTGTGKLTVIAPFAFTLTKVRAFATTAPTDADLEIDVNKNGTSVLSTVISIDATENDSDDSGDAAVISTASFADGDLIRFDIDQIGSTTAGAGAKVWLYVYRAS